VEGQAWQWLVIDGLVPLFGASVLFCLWGVARKATQEKKVVYAWHEAIDSMGWLYGTAILSIQSISWTRWTYWNFLLAIAALAAILLLLSAMDHRGEDSNWKPPVRLRWIAIVLTILVLISGYSIRHSGAPPPL
jgi:peptidoglycan/LPS O-acetylase OafA/YrhL